MGGNANAVESNFVFSTDAAFDFMAGRARYERAETKGNYHGAKSLREMNLKNRSLIN